MEQKKLPQADLNRQRPTGFLLGLVLAVAMLFVALEFDVRESAGIDADALLDEQSEEAELQQLFKPEEQLVMLAPEQESTPKEKLNIVEEEVELRPEEITPDNSSEGKDNEQTIEQQLEEMDDIEPPEVNPRDNPERFRVVQDMPQFPGGPVAFLKWLTSNLKYPPSAQKEKIEGKVVAQFLVNEDGSITDLKITKPLHPQCDREALRVLRTMPRWTPGIENDKPCKTRVCIPIVFKL